MGVISAVRMLKQLFLTLTLLHGFIANDVIGVRLDSHNVVKKVHIDSPASQVGLLKGDIILKKEDGKVFIRRKICCVTGEPALTCHGNEYGGHARKNEIWTAIVYDIEGKPINEVLWDVKNLDGWE